MIYKTSSDPHKPDGEEPTVPERRVPRDPPPLPLPLPTPTPTPEQDPDPRVPRV